MADRYIDYWEVEEYGGHFVRHAQELVGASPMVDMDAVRARVASAVARVGSELAKSGMKRSSLRQMGTIIPAARKDMRRFFQYLGSLDDASGLDVEAFFPGKRLGSISRLKPADLKARLDAMIRAFAVPANRALPRRDEWQRTLTRARDALAAALSTRADAAHLTQLHTAGLRQARQEFLDVYNGVAKPLTRGLLRSLGREHEFKLFFADLQVNEAGRPAARTPDTPAEPRPAQLG